ncbi:MAG: putative DsbA family dithiol-disulfide isomerase [Pirellulaceae bacterium]
MDQFHLSLKVILFPLHPATPPEGQSLQQLFAGRGIDVKASQAAMAERMADEGLPYGDRTMTYNSRRAQELAKWAESVGAGKQIHNLLYQTYFVAGNNLAASDTLDEVVRQLGLSVETANQALETAEFSALVDADWQRCHELGITGVPAFVCNGRGVIGAQSLGALQQLVRSAGARERVR